LGNPFGQTVRVRSNRSAVWSRAWAHNVYLDEVEECPLYGIGIDQDEEIEFPLEVIELKKKDRNYQLITDYMYWSQNWR